MEQIKIDVIKKLLIIHTIGLMFVLLYGCIKTEKELDRTPKYFFYDYRDGNWLLKRNAIIIIDTPLNDSVSFMEIINHENPMQQNKTTYYKKKRGSTILFSKNNEGYYIYFDFSSRATYSIPFNPFRFYTVNDCMHIQQDTIYDYLSYHFGVFNELGNGSRIVLTESLEIPLICKRSRQSDYYILSDIVGDSNKFFYLSYTQRIIRSQYFYNYNRGLYPFGWHREQIMKSLKKKGFGEEEILDSINQHLDYQMNFYDSTYFIVKEETIF